MTRKAKITLVLLLIAILLAVISVVIFVIDDQRGPVILFPDNNLIFTMDTTDEQLLEGVTARDDRSGDVSDTLRVVQILSSDDGSEVYVVYVAKDKKNNVTRLTRSVLTDGEIHLNPLDLTGTGESETEAETEAAETPAETEAERRPASTTPAETTTAARTTTEEAA